MNGLIALDIDGTLTGDLKPPPQPVIDYLHRLEEEGWAIAFITGRTFHFGFDALRGFNFPFTYAFQNGAVIMQMPEQRVIRKKYLTKPLLESLPDNKLIVYGGYEHQDKCFYVEQNFDPELLDYFSRRTKVFHETWIPISSFEDLELSSFPVIKYFGDEISAQIIADALVRDQQMDATIIRDPFDHSMFLLQATAAGINKGHTLEELREHLGITGVTIAAGDDLNDASMFDTADICIAMANAPESMKIKADVVAPLASQMGIIQGLRTAIQLAGEL